MVDLSQNQSPKQEPTQDAPAGAQPPVTQPSTPPKKPDDTSLPPIKAKEKIATPEQEEIKKELSELGIPPEGGTKKTKVLLAALGILFLIVALPAAVILVKERQEIRKEAIVSGKITVCEIELGPPTNEQPPSEANNGTYSIVVPIKNTSSDSKTVGMQTASCVCNEAGGSPSEKCYGEDKCQNSEPFEVTLNPGETYSHPLSAQQPTGVPCGSFQVDLVTLAVNGDTSCSIPWGTPVWGLWLTDEDVEECLAAPSKPDLIVQNLEIRPASPVVGNSMSFYGVVKNQGEAAATSTSFTHFRLDVDNNGTWDWPFDESTGLVGNDQSTGALAANATEKEGVSGWLAEAGTHKFEVCADWAGWVPGQVDESNEDNNCTTKTFSVGSAPPTDKPDLIVQNLEIRPASPVVGNSMSFYGVVKNQGGSTATPTTDAYIYTHFRLDVNNNGTWDWPFDEATGLVGNDQGTGTLAPNATEREGVSGWIAKAGTHKFEVCADWAGWVPGQVDESNEDNNCTTKTFSVGTTPPPEYTAQCDLCKVYDEDWNEITDLSTIAVNQTVHFATLGSTTHPQGITKARFRINDGAWQETTSKHEDEFYIEYTIPAADSYTVESMVYNPTLGWY